MKIVGFELEDWEQEAFERLKDEHEHVLLLTGEAVTEHIDSQYKDADIISTFIYSDLSSKALKQFQNLRLISTRSTGFDHIDLDYCKQNDIVISNVPRYGQNTVAEHAFALIHAIARHIPEAVQRTRSGSFSQEGLQGLDLKGKTIGVIGTGDIGKNVIRISKGYDMKVLAFDVKPDKDAASRMDFEYTDMNDLLSKADIITLHVPGIDKTRNMISEPQFEKMKPGAILINTARGFVVNIQDLLKALSEEKIAAAGLDVLPEEPVIREETELLRSTYTGKGDLQTLLADHMLTDLPNVIITPHIAFNTCEAVARLIDTSVENILSFIHGNPKNLVGKK
jgi:D-lactate dehydrogenase